MRAGRPRRARENSRFLEGEDSGSSAPRACPWPAPVARLHCHSDAGGRCAKRRRPARQGEFALSEGENSGSSAPSACPWRVRWRGLHCHSAAKGRRCASREPPARWENSRFLEGENSGSCALKPLLRLRGAPPRLHPCSALCHRRRCAKYPQPLSRDSQDGRAVTCGRRGDPAVTSPRVVMVDSSCECRGGRQPRLLRMPGMAACHAYNVRKSGCRGTSAALTGLREARGSGDGKWPAWHQVVRKTKRARWRSRLAR